MMAHPSECDLRINLDDKNVFNPKYTAGVRLDMSDREVINSFKEILAWIRQDQEQRV